MKLKRLFFFSLILGAVIFSDNNIVLSQVSGKAEKGTVFVPAYSAILHGELSTEFNLAITLSIHNTDMKNPIVIDTINYYNAKGKIIFSYLKDRKIVLQPLETYNMGVKESDKRGGIGANFIVKWSGSVKVNRPIIETIMIATRAQQGISFTSRGETISD
jgi:ABC-type lipopolysaccharide export system ATPase subunit